RVAPKSQHHAPLSSRTPTIQRRALLHLAAALLPLCGARDAHADRTGRYSTKLTAKRRYVARITRGMQHILTADKDDDKSDDEPRAPDAALIDDTLVAMQLFGTTYFSEGNRIGERERELKRAVSDARAALDAILRARRRADDAAEGVAVRALRAAVREWLRVADFERIAGVPISGA
ncbi:unnamed protein product, partial [Agarophyton chilense]